MKFAVDFKPLEWVGAGRALRAHGACGCTYWITRDGGSWHVEGAAGGFTRRGIAGPIAALPDAQAAANRHHSEAMASWISEVQPIND